MQKILIVATSVDGYIAQSREQVSTEWTSREDREWFVKRSKEIGTLIMGGPTYATIGRPLRDRKIVVMNEPSEWQELPSLADFSKAEKTAVYRTDWLGPRELIAELEKRGVEQVAICGGARVYQSFLQEELVDELDVTLESVLLGGGIKLTENLEEVMKLTKMEEVKLSEQTTVMRFVCNSDLRVEE